MKKPCYLLCGVFYVPIGIFCEELLGKFVTMADDTMCISGNFAQLGRYTARVIKNYKVSIIKKYIMIERKDCNEIENC